MMTCMELTGQGEILILAIFSWTGSMMLSALLHTSTVRWYGQTGYGGSAYMQDIHTAHISILADRLSIQLTVEDTVGE